MVIASLDHISLTMPVGSEPAARAFFTGVLGLAEIDKPEDGNRLDGCWFDLGAQQLHLLIDEGFTPATRGHPAFTVTDLDAARSALRAVSLPISEFKPSDGRERFFSTDPFGNRLEFLEARADI